jgi:hypothetical protein
MLVEFSFQVNVPFDSLSSIDVPNQTIGMVKLVPVLANWVIDRPFQEAALQLGIPEPRVVTQPTQRLRPGPILGTLIDI